MARGSAPAEARAKPCVNRATSNHSCVPALRSVADKGGSNFGNESKTWFEMFGTRFGPSQEPWIHGSRCAVPQSSAPSNTVLSRPLPFTEPSMPINRPMVLSPREMFEHVWAAMMLGHPRTRAKQPNLDPVTLRRVLPRGRGSARKAVFVEFHSRAAVSCSANWPG